MTEVPEFQPTICACTVATAAELPAVKVLSSSFLAEHPEGRFVALVVDAQSEHTGPGLVSPMEIGVTEDELHVLATSLDAAELKAAMVPRLLEALLSQGMPVLYLDPWVQVFGSLTKLVLEALRTAPVVMLPRTLRPLPSDGLQPGPADLHDQGAFDPGFIAVGKGSEPYLTSLDMPAIVPHYVVRDARLGLSVWNVADRPLHRTESGSLAVIGQDLLTVHFRGFDPRRPWLLSADFADRPRVLLSEHSEVAELCQAYRAELVRSGWSVAPVPYRFDSLIDGTQIPSELRADYRASALTPPPAFGEDGGGGFLMWACEATEHGGTRWADAVWRADTSLQQQFPAPFAADADAWREWCAGVGVASGRLPAPAVPQPRSEGPALLDQLGVSVVGSGPLAELMLAAARASGLPVSAAAGYPVVVRASSWDEVPAGRFVVDVALDATAADDRTGVNELWLSSEVSRAAAERIGGPIVRVVPVPVHDVGAREHESGEVVVFAALADHELDRPGNVLGAVSAFLTAFPDRTDVELRIAVSGAVEHPEAAERLRLATGSDPRISLVDDLDVAAVADAVVSLHRGGADDRIALRLAELAVRGVPVVASDHGAVAELFGKTAVLVPCHQGAEPDVQAAAKLLRSLADDLPTAEALGAAGREHVLSVRSVARVAEVLRERVEHAYRGWRARRPKPKAEVDPMLALQSAKHALLRQPTVDGPHRTPMAPALRKVVLRALDHYDNHMRQVLHTLIDGVERTVSELVNRQDALKAGVGAGELELLRAEVEQVAQRQSHFADQLIGVDDGVVRVRADMAGQGRRQRDVEDAVVAEAAKRAKSDEVLAERIDKLTVALDRTLDRIDSLESKVVEVFRERDTRLDAALRTAHQAQQTADALRRVVVRQHENAGDAPAVRSSLVLCDAGMMRLPSDDAFMLPLLSSNGVWEPELAELLDSVLEPDGIFLDVGAYVGYHSIRVLSRLGLMGAVVAVEPDASAAALLRHNVSANLPAAVADRMTVVEGAAWESAGELAVSPTLTGGVSVSPLAADAGEDVARVKSVRLDKALEEIALVQGMKLSVVKVDTPGRGHRALAGLVRLLRRDRPHVFLEFSATSTADFGDDPVTVLKEFGVWGYDLVPVATRQPASADQIVRAMEGLRSITLWLRPRPVGAKQAAPAPSVPIKQPADQAI
ncbi:FkbM family methyltransferase [Lentzea sp. BCCO 10_0061]|uniref:FkbM family methyltransferase n=1 Tax=Lentzea sokolovensis TaxID=3095429 RepID=A0ABU4V8A8_9PSEU|nr:FkbM family methyltransferase [Lentzea sp. BCCO 10_0061]MDX8148030.1 FkbM family methyltransferase [Lentzea sp. BCCO 10_0061]